MPALPIQTPTDHESVSALVSRLGDDLARILRAEAALFRLRFYAGLEAMRARGGFLATGVVLGLGGVGALVAGLVTLLARWLPVWGAAFLVGGGLLLAAVVLGRIEVRMLSREVGNALAPATEDTTSRSLT